MNLKDVGKVCLFSQMSGVVNINGQPAQGVKLVRTVDYSKKQVDETVTNAEGEFSFPAVFKNTLAKHLPQEFVVGQEIIAHYDGKQYELWAGVKRTAEENSEARGNPLIVSCDLTSEKNYIKVNDSPIFSLCTWDVEPDPKEDVF